MCGTISLLLIVPSFPRPSHSISCISSEIRRGKACSARSGPHRQPPHDLPRAEKIGVSFRVLELSSLLIVLEAIVDAELHTGRSQVEYGAEVRLCFQEGCESECLCTSIEESRLLVRLPDYSCRRLLLWAENGCKVPQRPHCGRT